MKKCIITVSESMRHLGLVLLIGVVLLAVGAQRQPEATAALPACSEVASEEGLHWECSGEQLLGSLAQTLKLYAEHLTAVLRNPPRDIQLLLYDYKQEHSTMSISQSYRIYKEQFMLPTEEILNPWDLSPGGDGPIFFINRQSPETVYFLEAPKKDPDCEVDWWLFFERMRELLEVYYQDATPQAMFTPDSPITQNIQECYYLPSDIPIWKNIILIFNEYTVPYIDTRYHILNSMAQNRKKRLSDRDLDAVDENGEHWVEALAVETYLASPDWPRIFLEQYGGNNILTTGGPEMSYEYMYENFKFVVGVPNLPSYPSEFLFEQSIKNDATLKRPQELGVDLGSDYDYSTQLAYFDAVADSNTLRYAAKLISDAITEDVKHDFTAYYASRGVQKLMDATEQAAGSAETLQLACGDEGRPAPFSPALLSPEMLCSPPRPLPPPQVPSPRLRIAPAQEGQEESGFERYIKFYATLWRPQELGTELSPEFNFLKPWPFIDIPVQMELAEPFDPERLKAEFQARFAPQLEELRSQLEAFGTDPAILDVQNWRFEASSGELPAGSYLVTVDGTLELTDPSQPASQVYFREVGIAIAPTEP